jgi:hypothetical protein
VADDAARAAAFDAQRSRYPMRREFASTRVQVAHASDALLAKIAGLGFRVEALEKPLVAWASRP